MQTASTLNKDNPEPLYRQLATYLKDQIRDGRLRSGDRIESESQLSARFGISRVTVRLAIRELDQQGVVVRKQGKGTFVSQPVVRHDLSRLHGLLSSLFAQSDTAQAELMRYELALPPPDIAVPMNIAGGGQVMALDRRYFIDARPIAFARSWLVPEVAQIPYSKASMMPTEQILHAAGIKITRVETSIRAESAGADLRRKLKRPKGSPVLVLRRTAYGDDGSPKEIAALYFCTSSYEFFFSTQNPRVDDDRLSIRLVGETEKSPS